MLRLLKRKIQSSADRTSKKEIEAFTNSLRGAQKDELALALAMSVAARFILEHQGILSRDILDEVVPSNSFETLAAPIKIGQTIKALQKAQSHSLAVGMMIWLHTLRSIIVPEVRYVGQEMWSLLQTGQSEAGGMYDLVTPGFDAIGVYPTVEEVEEFLAYIPPSMKRDW